MPIGDLARQDEYDVPLEQSSGVGWANRVAERLPDTWPARLARDAMGAVLAPGRALQSDTPITSEQMIEPMANLAGLVMGGSYAKPATRDASGMGIRAYHSSPHDFDKFDLNKIGTGEGAQVYGHGLYFAENPAVSGQGGQYWKQFLNRFGGTEREVAERLKASNFDRKAATGNKDEELAWLEYNAKHASNPQAAAKHAEMLEALRRLESGQPVGPRTYEVDINADPAHFMDWDKPLKEMSQSVKDALRDTWMVHPEGYSQQTGSQIYKINERQMATGGSGLAYKMNEAGIPGIKYLDEGSRGMVRQADELLKIYETPERVREVARQAIKRGEDADYWQSILRGLGDRTHNYVVFDPGIVDIMKKYGIAGAAVPPVMGALAAQDNYRQ
jgi:hypothetical protein